MCKAGEFILYCVVINYLTNDFEYSLRITQADLSFVANSALFESNILRFRALASIKLFEFAVEEDDAAFVNNFGLMTQALTAMENSLIIYKAEHYNVDELNSNDYGVALSHFTLAFIYHHFAQYLCDKRVKKVEDFKEYLVSDRISSLILASSHYNLAAENFKKVDHLMGEYLSKKH